MSKLQPASLATAVARVIRKHRKEAFILLAAVLFTALVNFTVRVLSNESPEAAVTSVGTVYVTGVEAYGGDLKTVNGALAIDWGTLYLGESKSVFFYVRSISNVPVRVTLEVTSWTPTEISQYMTLSWNYNNAQIAPGENQIPVTLTLTVPATMEFASYLIRNNIQSFAFSIRIYSTKA